MDPNTLLALVAAGGFVVFGFLLLGGPAPSGGARVKQISGKKTGSQNFLDRLKVEDSSGRRKQIEDSLGKIEEAQKTKKKKTKSLASRLTQANWKTKPQTFMIVSAVLAIVFAAIPFMLLKQKPLMCLGVGIVLGIGFPRFILNAAINRRQKKFISHFPDGMDIIVRGVRTGLPLNDCLKIIAHESPDPLGAEFRKVVEGESVGIPIEVCLEQLYERMPVSSVNFFATVLNIQKTTGGNLGESLSNLSNVLRGRKLLREKIKSLSAEAKMSAIIIGSLPIVIMVLVTVVSPDYMTELYTTPRGHKNLMICVVMMTLGTLMMRKMMNFKF